MSVHDFDHDDSERIGAAIRSAAERVEAPQSLRAHLDQGGQAAQRRRRRLAIPAMAAVLLALATAVTAGF